MFTTDGTAELREGDRIKAKKGETTLQGRLRTRGYEYDKSGLGIEGLGWSLDALVINGFTLHISHRPKPPKKPLPTVPGLYQANDPDTAIEHEITFRLMAGDIWLNAIDNAPARDLADAQHQIHGLVRLVREVQE